MSLSSPNRIIWQYFDALRRLAGRIGSMENEDERKQDIAVSILLAITVFETFLNIFFRVIVSEASFKHHQQRLLDDLNSRRSLDYKLRNWPRRVLGKGLNFTAPVAKAFLELKDRRNSLMHFTSTHQTINLPGIEMHGLADTSVFDDLTVNDAERAVEVVEGMVKEVFRLRGIPEEKLGQALHLWTGRVVI